MATLDQAKNYGTSLTGLGLQLALTTGISTACILGFIALRRTKTLGYLYVARPLSNKRFDPNEEPPPNGLYNLIKYVYQTTEQEVLDRIGLDAAMFLRFNRMCMHIAMFLCGSVVLILVPIHVSFTPPTINLPSANSSDEANKIRASVITALDTYSMMNVPAESPILYFHAIFTWMVAVMVMLLVYRNYLWYADRLHATLAQQVTRDEIQTRTVLVRGVPTELQSEDRLREYFQSINLGQVESVVLSRHFSKLERRIQKRDYYLRLLERSHLKLATNYFDAQVRPWFGIPHAFKKLKKGSITAMDRLMGAMPFGGGKAKSLGCVQHPTLRPPRRRRANTRRFFTSPSPSNPSTDSESEDDVEIGLDGVGSRSIDIEMNPVPGTVHHYLSTLPANADDPFMTVDSRVRYSFHEQPLNDIQIEDAAALRRQHEGTAPPDERHPLNWGFIMDPVNRMKFHEYQPKHLTPRGTLVYTIDSCIRKLAHHDDRVRQYREFGQIKEKFKPSSTAFVTFKSPVAAAICAQTYIMQTHGTRIRMAPEPRDVIWSSFALSDSSERWIARIAINVLSAFLIFIWIVPISLAVALVNLDQITQVIGFLRPIYDSSPIFKSFLSSVLPTFTATLFNILLPYLLIGLLKGQGFYAKSDMMSSLTTKYFYFLFFNVLLTFTIGQTLVMTVLNLFFFVPIEIPGMSKDATLTNILMLAAKAIPKGANLYVFKFNPSFRILCKCKLLKIPRSYLNYIVFQASLHACELLQVNWGVFISWYATSRFAAKTPRQLSKAKTPWPFQYFYYHCSTALVLIITIVYSVIHPLIAVCSLFYFAFGWFVYKHQLLLCYVKEYETNGKPWHGTVNWIFTGLILFEITMAGLLATNGIFVGAALIIPLFGFTIWFKYYCHKYLKSRCRHIPVDALVQLLKRRPEGRQPQYGRGQLGRLMTMDLFSSAPQMGAADFDVESDPGTHGGHGHRAAVSAVETTTAMYASGVTNGPLLEGPMVADPEAQVPEAASADSVQPMSESSSFDEICDPNPQTYYPPCLWSPLPSAMWLPSNPLHKGRFNLDRCVHIDQHCASAEMGPVSVRGRDSMYRARDSVRRSRELRGAADPSDRWSSVTGFEPAPPVTQPMQLATPAVSRGSSGGPRPVLPFIREPTPIGALPVMVQRTPPSSLSYPRPTATSAPILPQSTAAVGTAPDDEPESKPESILSDKSTSEAPLVDSKETK